MPNLAVELNFISVPWNSEVFVCLKHKKWD